MNALLVGDNSFIGVSHLTQERARDRESSLDIEKISQVIAKALACGATGYTFSVHPTNLEVLRMLKTSVKEGFDIYPVLPYAQEYVRLANEIGITGLIKEVTSSLSLSEKLQAVAESSASILKLDPIKMLRTYIDTELKNYLKAKPENARLKSILLHEVVTDVGLSLGLSQLFDTFAKHVRSKYHASPGFVTYNLAKLVHFFKESNQSLEDVVIMAPFNQVGFQMSPSRKSAEDCISTLPDGNIIAMSILAGGYLPLEKAIEHLKTLRNLSGIAVGVSSIKHAEDTFTRLNSSFSK